MNYITKPLSSMKIVSFLLLATALCAFTLAERTVSVPARDAVELSYPEFLEYDVEITNTSLKEVEIAVLDRNTGKQIKGFGLNGKGKATLGVDSGILKIKNTSGSVAKVKLNYVAKKQPEANSGDVYIEFTMLNNTMKSIPLIIPNVMNPNLSPMSSSGVNLKVGQEIYFKYKGKKQLLLVVDENIANGSKLDMAKIIKDRKKELRKK